MSEAFAMTPPAIGRETRIFLGFFPNISHASFPIARTRLPLTAIISLLSMNFSPLLSRSFSVSVPRSTPTIFEKSIKESPPQQTALHPDP